MMTIEQKLRFWNGELTYWTEKRLEEEAKNMRIYRNTGIFTVTDFWGFYCDKCDEAEKNIKKLERLESIKNKVFKKKAKAII